MKIKAVLWDFGGVVTTSPFEAFNRFEAENKLPRDVIRSINATNPLNNAWARLESNRISVEEFDTAFAEEASEKGVEIRGKQVLELLSGDIRPDMVQALRIIREQYKTACLTNNVKKAGEGPGMADNAEKAARISEIMALFDHVIESSVIGVRKPEPAFYQHACETLDIEPGEALFIDDLGINLKPAKEMGMETIKVLSSSQAIQDMESVLGISLR